MNEKKSIIKNPIIWVVIVALLLCVVTIFTLSDSKDTFKLTYKGETISYKIEDMPSHTMAKHNRNINGKSISYKEGEYTDIYAELFQSVPIHNYTKITYVFKDGTKLELDTDDFYYEGVGLFLADELRIEENNTVTLLHYKNSFVEDEELGKNLIFDDLTEYANLVEIIVEPGILK